MNVTSIKNAVTQFGGRSVILTKKHAPTILTAAGIVGGLTTTVLASVATLKLEPILADHLDHLDDAKVRRSQRNVKEADKAQAKETVFIYAQTGLNVLKLYGPAISVGIVSVTCVVSSHNIMKNREATLIAAYTAVERSFSEYRKRVEAALGVDKEKALRYGISEKKEKQEDGTVAKVSVVDPNAVSLYAMFFDEYNPNWRKNAEYNRVFLQSQQQFANDLLLARGHVFLNDVYDSLGIERTRVGAVVGWVLSKDGSGDNFIDFGLFNGGREAVREFVNGNERSILLDFNVDGVIFDKI